MTTLTERVDLDKLLCIQDNYDSLKDKLGRWKDSKRNYNEMTEEQQKQVFDMFVYNKLKETPVEYKFSSRNNEGRLYSKIPSLQGISKVLRHTISRDIYYDVDICNCHPNIFCWLASKNNFDCSHITYYNANRDDLILKLSEQYGMNRETVKNEFLKILNGGKHIFKNPPEWVEKYDSQCRILRGQILNLYQYKSYLKKAKEKKEDNIEGSAINLIFCKIENEILTIMIDFFKRNGIKVGCLCFDGLMIYKEDVKEDPQILLLKLEREISERYEIDLKLKYKAMDEFLDLSGYSRAEKQSPFNFDDEHCALYLMDYFEDRLKYNSLTNELYLYNEKTLLWSILKNKDGLMSKFYEILSPLTSTILDAKERESIVKKLGSSAKQSSILKVLYSKILATDNSEFIIEYFDRIPYLFPFKDKVYDFRNGVVRDREKGDYFTKSNNMNSYSSDYDKEYIIKYIKSILMTEDIEYIKNFSHICGYFLTNENELKRIIILTGGSDGGKSLFITLLKKVMGPFFIESNKKVFRIAGSEAVHDAEKLPLIRTRVAGVCEMKHTDRFNENFMKSVSGNDGKHSVRGVGKDEIQPYIECKLLLATNNVPSFEDRAFADRLLVFNFPNKFERKAGVAEEILSKSNDFFSYFCDMAHEFYNNRRSIKFCKILLENTEALKMEKDSIKNFFEENYIITNNDDDIVNKTFIYNEYEEFCKKNSIDKISKINFYKELLDKFPALKLAKKGTRDVFTRLKNSNLLYGDDE